MSLYTWQTTLLKMLPDERAASHILAQAADHLSHHELANLTQMSHSTGMEVTRDVQAWWRQARLQIAIPFSMRLIQRLELHSILEQYYKSPCSTLFFLREAQAFSDFIRLYMQGMQAPMILHDMVQFECALHLARLQQSGAAPPTNPAATELHLSHCPEACITALLQDTPLPTALPAHVTIQFNSTWPRLWRTA